MGPDQQVVIAVTIDITCTAYCIARVALVVLAQKGRICIHQAQVPPQLAVARPSSR